MPEIEPNETAWLIERDDLEGGLHYFANTEHKHFWTTDPNKAERFASEELARICCKGGDRDGSLRVCEHMWITPSARITGDKDRENPVEGAPYGEGLIGRIDELESKLRATAIEAHRLRSCLRYIADVAYVDHHSGNANFEYLQRLAQSALGTPTAPSGEERAVMVCPQCEGEGGYPDGMDEAACHTECTRCGSNGWIVDQAALAAMRPVVESRSYVEWQQKRGMLADKVDWAINEYDEFMKDDAYDAQAVLDRIIAGLRSTAALRQAGEV